MQNKATPKYHFTAAKLANKKFKQHPILMRLPEIGKHISCWT